MSSVFSISQSEESVLTFTVFTPFCSGSGVASQEIPPDWPSLRLGEMSVSLASGGWDTLIDIPSSTVVRQRLFPNRESGCCYQKEEGILDMQK